MRSRLSGKLARFQKTVALSERSLAFAYSKAVILWSRAVLYNIVFALANIVKLCYRFV